MVTCLGKSYHFLGKCFHFWGSMITLGWPQFTMSNPPNKSWQGSDPLPPPSWQCQDFHGFCYGHPSLILQMNKEDMNWDQWIYKRKIIKHNTFVFLCCHIWYIQSRALEVPTSQGTLTKSLGWGLALGDNPFFTWMNICFEWIILDFIWMNEIFEWIILDLLNE